MILYLFFNSLSFRGAAKDKNYLKSIGITHVVNCAEGNDYFQINTYADYYANYSIKYLGINILDIPTFRVSIHFTEVADFIERAIESGGRVLVHCFRGFSRSATMVVAYLMIKKSMMLPEALKIVKKRRPSVKPNSGFISQLMDLQLRIRAGGRYMIPQR